MKPVDEILTLDNPQIMVVVASPDEKAAIRQQLRRWGKLPAEDFWFFV